MSRACRAVAGLALACAVAAPSADAQTDPFASVVMVRCALAGGEAKATGFVWPAPGTIVTALHAVAGCEEIVVWSEATLKETVGSLARVDLEADLALVALEDDLGLAPVRHAETAPDVAAEHVTLGYPLAAEEMIRLEIEFGGGLRSDVTTLGQAFASDELEDLFRGQPYPTRDTSILRVNTTIQPGHSGAPIFDGEGAVVAIADGGLLGGWRTINWSIPAHLYLPELLVSEDPPPQEPSLQAQLFSSVTPEIAVEVGFERQGEPAEAEAEGALLLVRQISLAEFAEANDLGGEGSMVEEIRALAGDSAIFDALSYDLYEDSASGATIGVPSGAELYWNDALQALEAVNASETVRLTVTLTRAGSFGESFAAGEAFIDRHLAEFVWEDEAALGEPVVDVYDEEEEIATLLVAAPGWLPESGEGIELILGLHASGPDFLGTAVTAVSREGTWSEADALDYLMMEFGARFLTDFAVN